MKEYCRAWQRRLRDSLELLYAICSLNAAIDLDGKDLREISGRLLVLYLLFIEETSQGDNVGVDLLGDVVGHCELGILDEELSRRVYSKQRKCS